MAKVAPNGSQATARWLYSAVLDPTCALVDINLGHGAKFKVVGALQDRGVPFVVITHYDDVMISARFDGVVWVSKPTDARQVVWAEARSCVAGS